MTKLMNLLDRIDYLCDDDTINDSSDDEQFLINGSITNLLLSSSQSAAKLPMENRVPVIEPNESESLIKQKPQRGLTDTENPLETIGDHQFECIYRFNKETVQDILQMIAYGLCKHTNRGNPVSPIDKLLITLKFLATGK